MKSFGSSGRTVRATAKNLIPSPALRAIESAIETLRSSRGAQVPWDASYVRRKWHLIEMVLRDPSLANMFTQGGTLPPGYGFGIDERCIEYPWVMARLTGLSRLLDAGSSLNHEVMLDLPLLTDVELHILTLAPETSCFWRRGISYLYSDLRDIPIRTGFYSGIVCVSTLEHVGFDNTMYAARPGATAPASGSYLDAVLELRRVLAPGGSLYVTVPFGCRQDFGSFRVFDSDRLQRVIAAFDPSSVESEFFRYSPQGWSRADEDECRDSRYVEWVGNSAGQLPSGTLPVEDDHAAAARAVACLRLVKPD